MERVQFIIYKGKKILIENFSQLTLGVEFDQSIRQAQKKIAAEPEKSVRALFDCTDSSFTAEMLDQLKVFTKSNTPYIKKCAAVGIDGLLQVAISVVSDFSGREFVICKTREEALDILAALE